MKPELRKFLSRHTKDHEVLSNTPERYETALKEFLEKPEIKWKDFPTKFTHAVSYDLNFISLCEHHLLPFFGTVHISYVPNGFVGGASKFYRLVDYYSRNLQTQENLTQQIGDYLVEKLKPKSLLIKVEARHFCIEMRGIKKDSKMTTNYNYPQT